MDAPAGLRHLSALQKMGQELVGFSSVDSMLQGGWTGHLGPLLFPLRDFPTEGMYIVKDPFELLLAIPGEVKPDLFIVCGDQGDRLAHAEAAATLKIPCLVETPAPNALEGGRLRGVFKEHGCLLLASNVLPFVPAYAALRYMLNVKRLKRVRRFTMKHYGPNHISFRGENARDYLLPHLQFLSSCCEEMSLQKCEDASWSNRECASMQLHITVDDAPVPFVVEGGVWDFTDTPVCRFHVEFSDRTYLTFDGTNLMGPELSILPFDIRRDLLKSISIPDVYARIHAQAALNVHGARGRADLQALDHWGLLVPLQIVENAHSYLHSHSL